MTLFLELIWWMLDHWRDLTISGVLIFIGRKVALKEVQRLLHLDNGRDELEWTRKRVEKMTGETYIPIKPSWSEAQKNLKPLYKPLQAVIVLVLIRARENYIKSNGGKDVVINKKWLVGLIGYVLFFIKQFVPNLEVPDALIDNIADVVLLLMGIIPMLLNMFKPKPKEHPFEQNTDPKELPFDSSKSS